MRNEPQAPGAVVPVRVLLASPMTPAQLFDANLPVIEAVIRYVAGQYRLTADERDEFAGDVRLRLIDNDFEILRRFEHRSSLKTFLVTVVQRQFLDYRDRVWGKWRPSAEARRLGPAALRLERLVFRDGLTFEEAAAMLQTNERLDLSHDALSALFQKLPPRTPRRFVGEQALEGVEAAASESDAGIMAREGVELRRRVRAVVGDTVKGLPQQDRLIVKLHYLDLMTVADIARLMHLDQKALYRRVARLRQDLRRALEAAGITSAHVFDDLPEVDEHEA